MLAELAIENYAVIEQLRIRFYRGLNLLTGETGSGKSIVVDALGLLLGGRASADMVRTGADRSRVSGIFEIPASRALRTVLDSAGIEPEADELLIEREILSNGKSRAFVSNRPATAALLKDIAPHLGDIHGQHDQQRLFSALTQRETLDEFGRLESLVAETAGIYARWRSTADALADLDRTAQENLRLEDLWTFQRKEIEAIDPKLGEDEQMENDRRVLRNVARLEEATFAAYSALYDAPESATAQLRIAVRRLEEIGRIDAGVSEIARLLEPASVALEEAAHGLRHYMGKLEADPAKLDQIEARLAALEKLRRKYGASIAEILAFLDNVRQNLTRFDNLSERRKALEADLDSFKRSYEITAAKLSEARRGAASELSSRVERELASLAMDKTRFQIRVQPAEWAAEGADTVEFLFSPNPGEDVKPLDRIASGGELSRVALAIKTSASVPSAKKESSAPRTLVFDEVDAGVGGSAAEAVGRRLKRLASYSQVLCVTHLAQIAGFADHHYAVEKKTLKGRTVATIEELKNGARTREIGRMLSGERVTPEALRHAEQLLKSSSL